MHIKSCLSSCNPSRHPAILYLQANNCGAENKNLFMLAFLSLLISLNMFSEIRRNFQEICLSFLLVGHTHEDIDQLFSTGQSKFKRASAHQFFSDTHPNLFFVSPSQLFSSCIKPTQPHMGLLLHCTLLILSGTGRDGWRTTCMDLLVAQFPMFFTSSCSTVYLIGTHQFQFGKCVAFTFHTLSIFRATFSVLKYDLTT
jgi:hypothetical protein